MAGRGWDDGGRIPSVETGLIYSDIQVHNSCAATRHIYSLFGNDGGVDQGREFNQEQKEERKKKEKEPLCEDLCVMHKECR